MLTASDSFREYVRNGTPPDFKVMLTIGSTEHELSGDDIVMGGVGFHKASSSGTSFDIGSAVIGTCDITLNNYDRRWDGSVFGDSVAEVYAGYESEWVLLGTYTVEQPESYGATITLKGYDNLSKLERKFKDVAINYPATIADIAKAICAKCSLVLATKTFKNSSYKVKKAPDDSNMSCIDAIGYIAQVSGNFVDANPSGDVRFRWYDNSAFGAESGLDGGTFNTTTKPYSDGDSVFGGYFMFGGTSYSGGVFQGIQAGDISAIRNLNVNTDDKQITGVYVQAYMDSETGDDGESSLYGSGGYVFNVVDNPFVEFGRAGDVSGMLGSSLVGMSFRPLSTQSVADPTIEAGDAIVISDGYGRTYQTYATDVTYKGSGTSTLSCKASKKSDPNTRERRTKADAKNEASKIKTSKIKQPKITNQTGSYLTSPNGKQWRLGVDNNGNLISTERIPTSIQVTTPPDKTTYSAGQTIDYTGIVVTLYDDIGTVYTDDSYPNGNPPFEELVFPVTKVVGGDETYSGEYDEESTVTVESVGSVLDLIDYALSKFVYGYEDNGAIGRLKEWAATYDGVNPARIHFYVPEDRRTSFGGWGGFVVYVFTGISVGDEITLGTGGGYKNTERCSLWTKPDDGVVRFGRATQEDANIGTANQLAVVGTRQSQSTDAYGTSTTYNISTINAGPANPYGNDIPVQWVRQSDEETLEATFEITISKSHFTEYGGGHF